MRMGTSQSIRMVLVNSVRWLMYRTPSGRIGSRPYRRREGFSQARADRPDRAHLWAGTRSPQDLVEPRGDQPTHCVLVSGVEVVAPLEDPDVDLPPGHLGEPLGGVHLAV